MRAATIAAVAALGLALAACGKSNPPHKVAKKEHEYVQQADGSWAIWYVLWLNNGGYLRVSPNSYASTRVGQSVESDSEDSPAVSPAIKPPPAQPPDPPEEEGPGSGSGEGEPPAEPPAVGEP